MRDWIIPLVLTVVAWLIWWAYTEKSSRAPFAKKPPPKEEDPETRHLKNALQFAKTQHEALTKKQIEQAAWQQRYGLAKAAELDLLSGKEFEEFLAGLFRGQGYSAELTPITGDYGADLILIKDGVRIAVQAKRYAGSVGVQAVQEALSGRAYYQCDNAWVITTGAFTTNALELAKKSGVKMISRSDLGNLMKNIHT